MATWTLRPGRVCMRSGTPAAWKFQPWGLTRSKYILTPTHFFNIIILFYLELCLLLDCFPAVSVGIKSWILMCSGRMCSPSWKVTLPTKARKGFGSSLKLPDFCVDYQAPQGILLVSDRGTGKTFLANVGRSILWMCCRLEVLLQWAHSGCLRQGCRHNCARQL